MSKNETNKLNEKELIQAVGINGQMVNCKGDTGAEVNVIGKNTPLKLKIKMEPSKIKRRNYNGSQIEVIGQASLLCKIKNKSKKEIFQIVDHEASSVIGLPFIQNFNLLKRVMEIATQKENNLKEIMEKYKQLFSDIGSLKGYKYKIKFKKKTVCQ